MSDAPQFKLQIPPEVVKFIDKSASRDAKLLAAKGLVPMAPNVMFTALYMLMQDGDAEVSQAASKSLLGQPENLMASVLAQPIHPKILDFVARHQLGKPAILEVILLNKQTPDEIFVLVGAQVDERLLLIISENQERLLRTPKIAEELRKNGRAPQSVIDRMLSFLRLNGVVLEGMSAELTDAEVKQLMSEDDTNILQTIYDANEDASLDDLSVNLFEETAEEEEKKKEEKEDDRSAMRRLSKLTISQKIKLALKGNKQVRMTLIKDPNKLVSTSVMKNGKIQETELVAIAAMRSINDDVLRIIARSPEAGKNYAIKNALVNNPKCPVPISVAFMKSLHPKDLGVLAKNKNVSQTLQKAAKQLFSSKRK